MPFAAKCDEHGGLGNEVATELSAAEELLQLQSQRQEVQGLPEILRSRQKVGSEVDSCISRSWLKSSSFMSGRCRMGGSGRRDASSNFGEETPPADGGRLRLQSEGVGGPSGMPNSIM